jgi:hypothetical protein
LAANGGRLPEDAQPALPFVNDLTPREREVLIPLAEGKPMKQAADVLGITPRAPGRAARPGFHLSVLTGSHGARCPGTLNLDSTTKGRVGERGTAATARPNGRKIPDQEE